MGTDLCAFLRLLVILAHIGKTAPYQHYPKPAPPDIESLTSLGVPAPLARVPAIGAAPSPPPGGVS